MSLSRSLALESEIYILRSYTTFTRSMVLLNSDNKKNRLIQDQRSVKSKNTIRVLSLKLQNKSPKSLE